MSVCSVLKLISRGKKHTCIVSGIDFFEDEMNRIVDDKWIAKEYDVLEDRKDRPGRASKRRGRNWFRAN